MAKRRKYTDDLKRESVRLMQTRGERTVADVAESLGVHEGPLHDWKKKFALVLALSTIGLLLFGCSWLVLTLQPKRVEAAALDFMKSKILEEAREELQQRTPESLRRGVRAIQERLGIEARHLDDLHETALADQVGEVLARLCSCGAKTEVSTELRVSRAGRSDRGPGRQI